MHAFEKKQTAAKTADSSHPRQRSQPLTQTARAASGLAGADFTRVPVRPHNDRHEREADQIADDVLRRSPGGAAGQAHIESLIGGDFSSVRIHTGGDADAKATRLNALAFTRGSEIYFRRGAYDP